MRYRVKNTWIVLLLLLLLAGKTTAQDASAPPLPTLTHSDFSGEMCERQCLTGAVTIDIPIYETPAMARLVDVAFLFDVTSSMGSVLDVAKRESETIMQALVAIAPDSAFAAASFADYPGSGGGILDFYSGGTISYGASGDYPWRLDQDITTNTAAVTAGINRMRLLSGGDGPESYNRALYEARFLSWRPGAQRIVVLFGDAYPHDESFGSGGDPGRDARGGNADDLVLADVIAQLAADEISIISVIADNHSNTNVNRFFTSIAEATGGQVFALARAEDIPRAVVELVSGQIASIGNITLAAAAPYTDWLQLTPAAYSGIEYDGRQLSFNVAICPQPDTNPPRNLAFDLTATLDDRSFATIPVSAVYRPICLPPIDVYIADNAQDDGSGCSNQNDAPFWESPDIVLRHSADGIRTTLLPRAYGENYLYVNVRNRGTLPVDAADVFLYYAAGTLGDATQADWREIGRTSLALPAEGAAWTDPIVWNAPSTGPYRFLARVGAAGDPPTPGSIACDNNSATHNALSAPLNNQSLGNQLVGGTASFTLLGDGGELWIDSTDTPPGTTINVTLSDASGAVLQSIAALPGGLMPFDHSLPSGGGQARLALTVVTPHEQPFPVRLRLAHGGETVDGASLLFEPQPTLRQLPPRPELPPPPTLTLWPCTAAVGLVTLALILAILLSQLRAQDNGTRS